MKKHIEEALDSLAEAGDSASASVAEHLRTVAANGPEYATPTAMITEAEAVIHAAQWFLKGVGSQPPDPCQHLTGYWINKPHGNFRCIACQCQFHIGHNLPADHPTAGIEVRK